MGAPYGIDDLPRFSPWPARLLGADPWAPRTKNRAEIIREFDREKWGPLLDRLRQEATATVETVDGWFTRDAPASLASVGDGFELMEASDARRRHLDLVASTLAAYVPASQLVELGAGYGSLLLALARRSPFSGLPLAAGELAPNGVEILQRLARAERVELHAVTCDLGSAELARVRPAAGAIVFTSFATMYVRQLQPSFVDAICAWQPRIIVHFEPCYDHFAPQSLLGLMRRRYVDVNGYNLNLMSLLRGCEAAGRIRILEERANVFGANPLLPASVIAWTPTGEP